MNTGRRFPLDKRSTEGMILYADIERVYAEIMKEAEDARPPYIYFNGPHLILNPDGETYTLMDDFDAAKENCLLEFLEAEGNAILHQELYEVVDRTFSDLMWYIAADSEKYESFIQAQVKSLFFYGLAILCLKENSIKFKVVKG
jgi:hypothetical protein